MTARLPLSIEAPEHRFGFRMGADRRLVRWGQMLDYFRDLAEMSDRITSETIGLTTEGRPFALLTISAPENLARLPELIEIQARLADPRRRTEADREDLIARGKTVCLVTCSIHATEVGGTQMVPELVHRLLSGNDPESRLILKDVVLLLVPSLNPDGMELVSDWYARTLGTPYEGSVPPALYHRYAGHDNNRDWFMQTLVENRLAIRRIHNVWRPHIVFDLHQMQPNGPRYVVPPFIDPYEPNVDPLIQTQINALGTTMASELMAAGKQGVATSIIFDAYSPSRAYQHYHGGVRILSEAASVRIATPITLTREQLAESRGFDPRVRTQNHPLPWEGGDWRLRDIVDYNLIAVWTVLDHAARYRDRWLRNFARIQDRSLENPSPRAVIIPGSKDQRDPMAAVEMLRVLRAGDVEVTEATAPFTADGVAYPAGTHLIPLAQPFGRFAKSLLEVQEYPDLRLYPGGPPRPPYDITAHTLPLLMGVECVTATETTVTESRLLDTIPGAPGGIRRDRPGPFVIPVTSNASFRLVNETLDRGIALRRLVSADGLDLEVDATGAFVAPDDARDLLATLGRELGVFAHPLAVPKDAAVAWRRPRLGLYHSWRSHAIDAGWTRLVLEEHGFEYALVRDRDVRQGHLDDRFDAIVLPAETAKHILDGNSSADYPPEYAGGIGELGAVNLRRFVHAGGTLIALDAASELVIRHLYLPVTNALDGLDHERFYSPGSLLRLLLDSRHPIAWGYGRESVALFVNSPAFDVQATSAEAHVVASFPHTNQLLSGWIRGAEHLAGRAALVECAVGRGRVILFGFRPQFRAQCRATYRLLFNAIARATLDL